jgi:hypothetical protein
VKYITILILIPIVALKCLAQTLTEKLIVTDTQDSIYLKSDNKSFDKNGNYCFEVKQEGKEAFFTNKEKIGEYKFIGSTYGNGGSISYTQAYSDPKSKPWYYRNAKSTKVFGPVIGKLEKYMTTDTYENIAIAVSYLDTIYYYVNGKLISKNLRHELNSFDIDHYVWCAFSENGNAIYYCKKESLYHLFVNGKLIDKSSNSFNELHINNKGNYIYAEGRRPAKKIDGYDYMFFIHTKDSTIGPVRTVWDNDLTSTNAYYYSGDDNGPKYIAINNKLYKGLETVSNVTLIDEQNSLFSYKKKGDKSKFINVNGKDYTHPFDDIFYPQIDNKGNFSFYGLQDYYFYKYVNGVKDEKPITNYGVRPTPLYISPKGESIHFFKTDDSLYLYKDDKLLFNPLSKKISFKVVPQKEILPSNFVRGKSENGNSLFYIEIDSVGYLVYNGEFSKPMIPAKQYSYDNTQTIGEIVMGSFNEFGFFIIQKIEKAKYLININNKIYFEFDSVDSIVRGSHFFDEKELIFYGAKKLSFYQFNFKL